MSSLTEQIYTKKTSEGAEPQKVPKLKDGKQRKKLSKRLRWSSKLNRKRSRKVESLR